LVEALYLVCGERGG
nr:Chain C, insulin B peptide [synthetic construct]